MAYIPRLVKSRLALETIVESAIIFDHSMNRRWDSKIDH